MRSAHLHGGTFHSRTCPFLTALAIGLGSFSLMACGDAAKGDPTAESGAIPAESHGRLVIVGGGLSSENADVYHAVLEGRDGNGPFCVMPTASGVPEESMNSAVERFTGYAADARYSGMSAEVTGLWITTENPEAASDSTMVERIEACSGFWFVGGVQSRVMQVFRPATGDSPGYRALMRRWREGAVVAGSSAGAAMMSSRSIGSGTPAAALEFGVVRDADGDGEEDGEGVWLLPGMDFVPWAIVGQHHLARGRWGRLVVAVLEEEDRLGLGIDENTALVYDDDGIAEVVGASGVLMFDVTGATPGDAPRTATGIRVEFLGAGDRVDVRTLAVTRSTAGKAQPTPPPVADASGGAAPDEDGITPPTIDEIAADPFARWALLHLLHAFAAGTVDEVALDGGARTLTLRRAPGFASWARAEEGVQGTPAGLSAGPLTLDITR